MRVGFLNPSGFEAHVEFFSKLQDPLFQPGYFSGQHHHFLKVGIGFFRVGVYINY